MESAKPSLLAKYSVQLLSAKNFTENLKKLSIDSYADFTRLFASNCFKEGIPEDVVSNFIRKELNAPTLDLHIVSIVKQIYDKRKGELARKPPSPVTAKKEVKKSTGKTNVNTNTQVKKIKPASSPKESLDVAQREEMQRLQSLTSDTKLVMKHIILYDRLKKTGAINDISMSAKILGVMKGEERDYISNFIKMGLIASKNGKFEKTCPPDLFEPIKYSEKDND